MECLHESRYVEEVMYANFLGAVLRLTFLRKVLLNRKHSSRTHLEPIGQRSFDYKLFEAIAPYLSECGSKYALYNIIIAQFIQDKLCEKGVHASIPLCAYVIE